MSLTTKRQLPNLQNENIRQNRENYSRHAQQNFPSTTSSIDKIVRPHSDRRSEDISRKSLISIDDEEDRILQTRRKQWTSQSDNTRGQFKENHSTVVRECTKSIREDVLQFKNQLMRNEKKSISNNDDLSNSLTNRRTRREADHRQVENEYLMDQQTMLSKSTVLNEMLSFKKELDKSERRSEQLSDHLESIMKTSDEKEKILSKTLVELKDITENCDTLERQNIKLQHDLTLALEKLEEMTEEAERFAEESLTSQKQLADCEQKREESQIQSQETLKQWNARVKKLEKDLDRYKLDSIQMSEKHEELIQENQILKSRNSNLKEQNINDINEANIKYKRLEEHFQQNENNVIHLRSIQSSEEMENATLKGAVNELENQLSIQRQRLSQSEKEKENIGELHQEESKHRHHLHLKLKQSEQTIETLNASYSQLENEHKNFLEKFKEIQSEKDFLLKEKTKFLSMENDAEEIKKTLETMKIEYTRGMKVVKMNYEDQIEVIQLELSEKKGQYTILQRHESESRREIERLREKSAKYEDENTQAQCTIETLHREMNDKTRLIEELESKINKLITEINNQKNEILQKDQDYQNSLRAVHKDIIYCTGCLSNGSNKPFIIEPVTTPRDDIEIYSSKLKAHLAWLKQELEIRHEEENKLRQELNHALMDCENDRKHFATELTKREEIIQQLTDHQYPERDNIDYDTPRISSENGTDRMDQRYRQFQTMVDSVKRELHTAKAQLLT